MTTTKPSYKRVLLKLSGEALMGDMDFGIETSVMSRVAREIAEVSDICLLYTSDAADDLQPV